MESKVERAMRSIITLLTAHPDGLSLDELMTRIGATEPTVRRARDQLQDEGAKLEYVHATRKWVLREPYLCSPTLAPRVEDLTALMIAQALIEPLVDDDVFERLTKLIEDMADQVHEQTAKQPQLPGVGSITRAVTMATSVDTGVLRTLLASLRRAVVRIEYRSPWSGSTGFYAIEPWGIRLVDASVYVRGHSRDHGEARTFNLAMIHGCTRLEGEPTHPRPRPAAVWDDGDPAFGIDRHQPGTATIRLRGPVARWANHFRWDASEVVVDLGDDVFERTVAYRSRREFARRLLSVLDAIVSIEPKELAEAVEGYVATYLKSDPRGQITAAGEKLP